MINSDKRIKKSEGRAKLIWSKLVGQVPAAQRAIVRLDLLGVKGPTSMAFGFDRRREHAAPTESIL